MQIQILSNLLFCVSEVSIVFFDAYTTISNLVISTMICANVFGLYILVRTMIEIADLQINHEAMIRRNRLNSDVTESSNFVEVNESDTSLQEARRQFLDTSYSLCFADNTDACILEAMGPANREKFRHSLNLQKSQALI